ncbi:unnamed protein product [Phytophthora fragariaefolia]|uniref:Unnamed protein product n=1 Tax=Phytophthora fragariaefolia TaxID=1490495 RepID=A0A9W6Y381_9STRA|nr:unnamed protein product [Phytophthora fragariaefolia]
MTVFQDSLHDPNLRSDNLRSRNVRSDNVQPESPDSDAPVEFRLQPGEHYGWWEDHEPEDAHEVAIVHGAVNDCRTKILLDTGASVTGETYVQDANVDTQGLRHVASVVIAATPARDDASSERRFPEMDDQPETLNVGLDKNAVSDFFSQGFASMPVRRLETEYARAMRASAEELDPEPAVYVREGSELMAQLRDQLAMLPELQDLSPECKIEEADVGEPGVSTPEMDMKLREILEYHRKIFLGDGNAAPAPARGVICDLDVGNVRAVAQRARQFAPHLLVKVYELLKKLLEKVLIEHSESEWASPIVIVLKKNGVDIRMCIDYRVVNEFIKLSRYPLPLIDDLLIGFESAMWFMSLDMASDFWAVLMTELAKLISAFICPFGHFQWISRSDSRTHLSSTKL